MEKNIITLKRQRELIKINRVLAYLVVGFVFFSGYLLSVQEEWLQAKETPTVKTSLSQTIQTNSIQIQIPNSTPFTDLLQKSRYERTFMSAQISKDEFTSLIWSAQGKVTVWGERTVPSYKSTYPLTVLVLVRQVEGVTPGLYRFDAESQRLFPLIGSFTMSFPETQPGLIVAPLVIGVTSSISRYNNVLDWNEAGGIAQNILLDARNHNLITFLIPAELLPHTSVSTIYYSKQFFTVAYASGSQ